MAEQQTNEPQPQQPAEQPVTREREVIVTNNGGNDNGSGSGLAAALVAIFAIIAILVVGWLAINAFTGDGGGMEIPSEFDVNINDNTGGDSSDSGGQ